MDGPSIPPVAGSSRAPVAGCSRAPAPFPSPADLDPALTPWEAAGFYPPADDTDADSALSEGGRERLAGFWKVAVREFWLGCSWGSRGRRYLRPAELEQVTTGCTALFGVPRRHWCPPCHRELGEQTLEYLPVEPGTRMPAYTPSSSSGVPLSPSVLSRASSIARGWRREAPGDGDGDSVRIGPVGAVSSSAHSSIYRDGPDIFNRGSSVFGHHSTSAEDRERRRRPPSSLDNRSSSLFHSCRVASTVSFAGVISESGVPGSPPPFPFPAPDVFTDDIRGGGHDGTGPLGISFSRALELLGELNELSEMQDSKRAGSGGSVRTEGEGELLADDNGLYPLERVWAQSEPRTPTEEAAAPPRDSGLLAGLRRRAVKWGRALASRGSSSRQKRKGEEGAEPGGEDEKAGEEERGAAGEEAAAIRGEMMTPAQWLAGAGAAR